MVIHPAGRTPVTPSGGNASPGVPPPLCSPTVWVLLRRPGRHWPHHPHVARRHRLAAGRAVLRRPKVQRRHRRTGAVLVHQRCDGVRVAVWVVRRGLKAADSMEGQPVPDAAGSPTVGRRTAQEVRLLRRKLPSFRVRSLWGRDFVGGPSRVLSRCAETTSFGGSVAQRCKSDRSVCPIGNWSEPNSHQYIHMSNKRTCKGQPGGLASPLFCVEAR